METLAAWAGDGVDLLVSNGLLPLVSIIVEPAKVLFLNNAINHGVLGPLGVAEALEDGKSILFMIETNPGPGLGILLAYLLFGPRSLRPTAPGAIIIHFFGGIHEIYFPYVLMNPRLILAAIVGGAAGVFTAVVTGAGLVATPSPGSIFAYMAVTPPDRILRRPARHRRGHRRVVRRRIDAARLRPRGAARCRGRIGRETAPAGGLATGA